MPAPRPSRASTRLLISTLFWLPVVGCAAPRMDTDGARSLSLGLQAAGMMPIVPIASDWLPLDLVLVQRNLEQERATLERGGVPVMEPRIARLCESVVLHGDPEPWVLDRETHETHQAHLAQQEYEEHERASVTFHPARVLFPVLPFRLSNLQGSPLSSTGLTTALDHLGNHDLDGTWTVLDGWRISIDMETVDRAVRQFVSGATGKQLLAGSVHDQEHRPHLRVITDVFLVGALRWRLEVGEGTSSLQPLEADVLRHWTDREVQGRGHTVRFVAGTNRSLTFDESYDRPMVIGFHGLDYPVLAEGQLGAPVPTRHRLAVEARSRLSLTAPAPVQAR